MIFRRFWWKIGWRVGLILGLSFLLSYTLQQTGYIIVPIVLALLLLLVSGSLIYFIHRIKRDISSMLLSIKQGDFTKTFKTIQKDDQLYEALQALMEEFQKLNIQKESHYHYLQTVVDHVPIPLLSYHEQEDIELLNPAFKNLFNIPYLNNLEGLTRIDAALPQSIRELKPGEKILTKLVYKGELISLSIQATEFRMQDDQYKVVSFQNIKNELDEQEVESWQKLIRVLTHEISNSVMPISSLSKLSLEITSDDEGNKRDPNELEPDDLEDLHTSLKTIEGRSRGLMSFVQSYRSLTHVPKPDFQPMKIQGLFANIQELKGRELKEQGIQLSVSDPGNVTITADQTLLEQVLINLINNARDAFTPDIDNPAIELGASQKDNKTLIELKDNGPGMDQETMQNIFVPFFTTKKNGSGIGLSLSRQIMRAHKGRIVVRSAPGEGAAFVLEF